MLLFSNGTRGHFLHKVIYIHVLELIDYYSFQIYDWVVNVHLKMSIGRNC